MHIVFYEGSCPFCNRMVRFILHADKRQRLMFAPLEGVTAKEQLPPDVPPETMIFVEHCETMKQRFFAFGRGALRICWHLGGWWRLIGWMGFFPNPLANFLYKQIARRRHRLFKGPPELARNLDPKRFLP